MKPKSLVALGFSKAALGVRIDSTIARKKYKFGADFKSFDSSVHPELIKMAFSVLRTHFDLSNDEEFI